MRQRDAYMSSWVRGIIPSGADRRPARPYRTRVIRLFSFRESLTARALASLLLQSQVSVCVCTDSSSSLGYDLEVVGSPRRAESCCLCDCDLLLASGGSARNIDGLVHCGSAWRCALIKLGMRAPARRPATPCVTRHPHVQVLQLGVREQREWLLSAASMFD